MVTLKEGYDVVGAKEAVLAGLYTITDDDSNIVFPTGSINTGKQGQISTYGGHYSFFMIGDLRSTEPALRNTPEWGLHDGVLMILDPGLDSDARDRVDEIGRQVQLYVEGNPTFSTTGLKVTLSDTNPFVRRRISAEEDGRKPKWNTGLIINLDVKIANIQE